MDGYSPRVEQSVAICSAIFSSSPLRLLAADGLKTVLKASGRSKEKTYV